MLKNLRKLRNKKGLTQAQLANALGINQQTVADYEKGNTLPSVKTLEAIADYFETNTDYVLGRTKIDSPTYTASSPDSHSRAVHLVNEMTKLDDDAFHFLELSLKAYLEDKKKK